MERWGFGIGHRDGRKWSEAGWPMWTSDSQPGLWRAGSLCPRAIGGTGMGTSCASTAGLKRVGEFGR